MKQFWLLIVIIFSAVIFLGARSAYTTSRITVLREDGYNLKQNSVSIRYEESRDGYNFHKRAEYNVYLKGHVYEDFEGKLRIFSKDPLSPFALSLTISKDGFTTKRFDYKNLTTSRGAFFYNEFGHCQNPNRSDCSEDEKALYYVWGEKLWTAWRERMNIDDNLYEIEQKLPPLIPARFSHPHKLDIFDFITFSKRKAVSPKVVIARLNAGTVFDVALINYYEKIDGFHYQKTFAYHLHLKTNRIFDSSQGFAVIYLNNGAEAIDFSTDKTGENITGDVCYDDMVDEVGTYYSKEENSKLFEQADMLWKNWRERTGIKKLALKILASPPEPEPESAPQIVFEDFMP